MEKILRLKKILEDNKIIFETLAATLLAIMAIIVSISQAISGCKQTALIEIQTKIAQNQFECEEREKQVGRISQYGELSNAIEAIFAQFPSENGSDDLRLLTQEQQTLLFERIEKNLNSQMHNTILNEDKECLAHWHEAINYAQEGMGAKYYNPFNKNERIEISMGLFDSICSDVSYVQERLIWNSKEFPFPYYFYTQGARKRNEQREAGFKKAGYTGEWDSEKHRK